MDQQAQVQTGYVYPSAGVRVLIPLFISAFMEEASGERMFDMADYNIGVSVGSVPAAASSLASHNNPNEARFEAKDVLLNTFVTAYLMFNRNPQTLMVNNAWRDVDMLRNFLTGLVGRNIVSFLESRMPAVEDSRYDPAILEATLSKKFGATSVCDARRPFFVVAHGISDRKPAFFTNVDPDAGAAIARKPLFMNRTPIHRDIPITEAIMAATAIPGLIGFRHVGSIAKHFMDPGSFAVPSFFNIMRDMHDIAVGRALSEHEGKLSARPVWKKVADAMSKAETPPAVVSRMVYLGIGDESGMEFDVTNRRGVITQAGDIVRAASDHVRNQTFDQIATRFDTASVGLTGRPAMRVIDSSIVPAPNEDPSTYPSPDIKDGQLQNLLKLLAFGRRVAVENREAIFDEIMLRMHTLAARGERTAEQVETTGRRLARYANEEDALALCDKILVREEEVASLFEHHGVRIPKPQEPQEAPKGGWRIPGMQRLTSSVMSFVV